MVKHFKLSVFSLQNAFCFIILKYLVPVLFTFYIQGALKLKKNNFGATRLTEDNTKFTVHDLSTKNEHHT